MSRDRVRKDRGWVRAKNLPRGPNGRALCRMCGQEVQGRRRTFCSDACVTAWKIQTNPGFVQRLVFRRDRGVCAVCCVDTEQIHRDISEANRSVGRYHDCSAQCSCAVRTVLNRYGLAREYSHYWEADHTVPVVEGGGLVGLDGYRTLCIACHHKVTRELRARLSGTIVLDASGLKRIRNLRMEPGCG